MSGQIQTGGVAGCQLVLVPLGQGSSDGGPYGVEHVPAGQVEGRGDLGRAGGLLVALLRHQGVAGQAELDAGAGVDDVVDTGVAGLEAAQQGAVGRVDDGVGLQPGDVPLPEHDPGIVRRGGEGRPVDDAPVFCFPGKVGILKGQKIIGHRTGRPDVHQGAQQPALAGFVLRDGQIPVGRVLVTQGADEADAPFFLGHGFFIGHRVFFLGHGCLLS